VSVSIVLPDLSSSGVFVAPDENERGTGYHPRNVIESAADIRLYRERRARLLLGVRGPPFRAVFSRSASSSISLPCGSSSPLCRMRPPNKSGVMSGGG
jgi:hypothetical protein